MATGSSPPDTLPPAAGPRVLVVGSERIAALNLRLRLEGMGYQAPATTCSGEQAVILAERTNPDLVLTDTRLGQGMTGIEAGRIIRVRLSIPVLYMTDNPSRDLADPQNAVGPSGYVLKPVADRELQILIDAALHRHGLERQLLRQRQFFAAALGGIGDGIVVADRDGKIVLLNPAAEQLFGGAGQSGRARSLLDLAHSLDAVDIGSLMRRAATGDPAPPSEAVWQKDGTRTEVSVTVSAVGDGNGAADGFVCVVRDTSRARRSDEQFRQAQKMEVVGRLAGGVVHDFNNLLVVINGYSNLLLTELRSDDPRRESVMEIRAAGTRAAGLTRQILAFSRRQLPEPTVLNVNDVVANAEKMLRRLIGEDVRLTTALDPAAYRIKADPGHLEQVIMNLVINARDAMPRGGKVTITTTNVDVTGSDAVERPDVVPGRYVCLSVADTGTGMPDEVKARLFEPFFTTKGPDKGTGLGLAVVQGFVSQTGGRVTVTTAVGVGTTFHVLLPATPEKIVESSLGGTELLSGMKRTETILVVEDEAEVRRITRVTLESRGYTVLEAQGGKEAIEVADRHPGTIHLLITDVVMPEMGGRQVADELLSRRPGLRVMFVSGHLDDAIRAQGVVKGADTLLRKPFTPSVLTKRVRAVLDHPS